MQTSVTEKTLATPNPPQEYRSKKQAIKLELGIVYEGEWLGELKHGFGVQKWPDGATYEGQWAEGKASGEGKFVHADGDVYEG